MYVCIPTQQTQACLQNKRKCIICIKREPPYRLIVRSAVRMRVLVFF